MEPHYCISQHVPRNGAVTWGPCLGPCSSFCSQSGKSFPPNPLNISALLSSVMSPKDVQSSVQAASPSSLDVVSTFFSVPIPPSCTAAAWGQNSSCAGSFPCTLHLHPAAAPRDGIFPVHSPTNTSMLKFAVNTCKSQYLSNKSAETNIFVCIKELEFPLQLPEPLAIVTLVPSCIVFASARY